jgi:CRP-like cAMP-binding protein
MSRVLGLSGDSGGGLGATAQVRYPAKMPLSDGNALILSLPAEDRDALMAASTPFEFEQGHIFCEAGDEVCDVTFPEKGVISAVSVMEDGRTVETYMIGREGVTHPIAPDAVSRCYSRLVAQIAGSGRRIDATRLRALMDERIVLRDVMSIYALRLMSEMEQSVACNALHRSEQRFAKWLLRGHDRIEGNEMRLTQEFLASMLGSQRSTVNEAAQQLQRAGAIRYSRGRVTILDRSALEKAACECYRVHCGSLQNRVIHPRLSNNGR